MLYLMYLKYIAYSIHHPISIYFAIRHFALWHGQFVVQRESKYQFYLRAHSGKKPGLVPYTSIVAESAPRFHPSWCGFFISHEVLFLKGVKRVFDPEQRSSIAVNACHIFSYVALVKYATTKSNLNAVVQIIT